MNKILFIRKGLVLLLLFATTITKAQTVDSNYKNAINAKLAGLDKTKIPTKLLINQAMEFANLADFNGVNSTTNFVTKGKFESIYNTLLMARVSTTVPNLINPTTFKTNWDNLRLPNRIVLSGLYYKYNKFKPNAYPNFLVNNAGVVTDKYVGGVWQNPYIDQQVFAISAPILVYKSLSMRVTLPTTLWYTNQATSVQSIAIDFGNSLGYLPMTLGQVRAISYSTSGIYEWKYKLTLTDNTILYSHSKLNIDIPVLIAPPTGGEDLTQTTTPNSTLSVNQAIVTPPLPGCEAISIIPFTGTRQYLGAVNSATLQIKYLNNDCIIRNPLIIVEGFDSGLLGVENPFGEVSYRNFFESTFKSYDLYSQVVNKDVIYINFNKGRDDLKRNAYLVEDIIKWVNTKKAQAGSTTPNIVLGQSMGGVIARYALRDLEMLNQPHQTGVFISHDAPQQGANIPVGIQYFARHLADQFVGTPLGDFNISVGQGAEINIEDIRDLFNAQGTKQLLSSYISSGFALDNTVFNTFQTELRTMGYPTTARNIALSNGNHCANTQEFNPSATLFSLNGSASTTALTTALSTLLQPLTGLANGYIAYQFNSVELFLVGFLPGSSNFTMDFSAKALPTAGTSGQVYQGGISYNKVIFDFFGWRPTITVSLTNRSYNNPVSLSYDYYPGGKYQLPFNFASTNVNNAFINAGITAYLAPSFNFIPVTSALDVGRGNTPLNNSDFLRKYTVTNPPIASKSIPFANYTTSAPNGANTNEPHISFNTRNGNWLAKEIDNAPNNNDSFDCTYICSDNQIAGLNVLCSTSTYSTPTGANAYNWTVTQGANLVTISGTNLQTVTLTPLQNASGQITLSLTIGDNGAKCGNLILTKTIWVGKTKNNQLVERIIRPCAFEYRAITNLNFPEIYEWEYVSGTGGAASLNDINFSQVAESVIIQSNTNFTIQLKLTVTNACGSIVKYVNDQYTIPAGPPYCPQQRISNATPKLNITNNIYSIYPNPSSDFVNIGLRDQNNIPLKDIAVSGELFDIMGFQKSKVEIINNKAYFSVVGLPKGIYVLKIYVNGQVESHQIAIQ